jgi:prostatic aicd phosphatase
VTVRAQTYNNYLSDFYDSDAFKLKANQSAAFLAQLPPYLDGRPVTLENMVRFRFLAYDG